MSRFANGKILSLPSRLNRQCKINIQNLCLFIILLNVVMLGVIWIGFKIPIWCCIFTHIFFSLNTEDHADLYIIKPPNLSSTRKCDNEPQGTLFSWFGLSYFYRIKAISLITADHLQWAIYVKTKGRVYMCMKKTSAKLSTSFKPF